MPEAVKFTYKCTICGKKFTHKDRDKAERKALDCEQNHDIVYVPLMRSQVQDLVAFIFSGERGLITEELLKILKGYR